LIQGSWNYRLMQGLGMAFAILPVLRHLRESGPETLGERVARHAEHFNAHPYFSSVALGALARLEVDGESPETVRRFRAAIRGPLGALGDRLVWATWLPLSAVLALVLYWVGLPGWLAVTAFLIVFNALHLTIRLLGFRLGFDAGTAVGVRLRGLGVTARTERVSGVLIFLVGLLGGVLLQTEFAQRSGVGVAWAGAAALAFLAGIIGGVRLWRPAAIATVASVVFLLLLGLRAS
jgi:PTS system mannose-specific IID component